MIYNFQLHRITLILIVALLGVGGGLLFFSGLLVGVSWQLPPAAPGGAVAAAAPTSDAPEAFRQEVVLPAAPAVAAPAAPKIGTAVPAVPAAPSTLPAGSAPAPLSPEAVTIPGEAPPAAAPPAPLAEKRTAAAPAMAAAPVDPLRGLRPEQPQQGFALQVGAFSQAENTQKLLQELAARGFEPYVVRTATSGSRQVESVRLGHFASRNEAAAAGSELARAEGIRAFVVRASGIVQ
jgi:cell division septation protein DedD